MIENKNIFDEDKFKDLIEGSKLTASENLKFRIMQQIETEQALKPKKVKSEKPMLKSVLSIALVMYVLMAILAAIAYAMGGFEALTTAQFILPATIIACSGAIFGLVVVLDEKRYRS